MDHNYVRDEENEEVIMRAIWGKAHPDDGGEDAGDGTNAGDTARCQGWFRVVEQEIHRPVGATGS